MDDLDQLRNEFAGLPRDLQLARLREKATNLFRSRGFRTIQATGKRYIKVLAQGSDLDRVFYRESDPPEQIELVVSSSALKTTYDLIQENGKAVRIIGDPDPGAVAVVHYIIVSVRPVPVSRIGKALRDFKPLGQGSYYNRYRAAPRRRPTEIYVHTLSKIESLPEFAERLRGLLGEFNLNRPVKRG